MFLETSFARINVRKEAIIPDKSIAPKMVKRSVKESSEIICITATEAPVLALFIE